MIPERLGEEIYAGDMNRYAARQVLLAKSA
jgi:hypothetical protein